MRSLRPRFEARSSKASLTREAPPVSTTIPSALRVSFTSLEETWDTNQRNPSGKANARMSTTTAVTRPSLLKDRMLGRPGVSNGSMSTPLLNRPRPWAFLPLHHKAKPRTGFNHRARLVDGLKRAIDRLTRRCRDQHRDYNNLNSHRHVARCSY